MSITIQQRKTASSTFGLSQERPATLSERAVAAIDRLSTDAAAELASRRLVRTVERRRQRAVTILCAALIAIGGSGTLAFASLLVAGR